MRSLLLFFALIVTSRAFTFFSHCDDNSYGIGFELVINDGINREFYLICDNYEDTENYENIADVFNGHTLQQCGRNDWSARQYTKGNAAFLTYANGVISCYNKYGTTLPTVITESDLNNVKYTMCIYNGIMETWLGLTDNYIFAPLDPEGYWKWDDLTMCDAAITDGTCTSFWTNNAGGIVNDNINDLDGTLDADCMLFNQSKWYEVGCHSLTLKSPFVCNSPQQIYPSKTEKIQFKCPNHSYIDSFRTNITNNTLIAVEIKCNDNNNTLIQSTNKTLIQSHSWGNWSESCSINNKRVSRQMVKKTNTLIQDIYFIKLMCYEYTNISGYTTTNNPTAKPSKSPFTPDNPTNYPSKNPTSNPTLSPTNNPTSAPSTNPTPSPTTNPTPSPTIHPTASPTDMPVFVGQTVNPTVSPTPSPTDNPTDITNDPTPSPTTNPTAAPSKQPTIYPTESATIPPNATISENINTNSPTSTTNSSTSSTNYPNTTESPLAVTQTYSKYLPFAVLLTPWDQARVFCQQRFGTDLATINSDEDWEEMQRVYRQLLTTYDSDEWILWINSSETQQKQIDNNLWRLVNMVNDNYYYTFKSDQYNCTYLKNEFSGSIQEWSFGCNAKLPFVCQLTERIVVVQHDVTWDQANQYCKDYYNGSLFTVVKNEIIWRNTGHFDACFFCVFVIEI